MKVTRLDREQAKHDPTRANYFEGEARFQSIVGQADGNELDILNVYFSAGARTIPHIHKQDQVLHIIEGRGIVAFANEKRIVTAGDIILIPAGTWHWHGATPQEAMAHISVMKQGQTEWVVEQKNWADDYRE